MIVQIYEIQTPQEAEKCIALGVDHIGSVLLSGTTWRQPNLQEVIRLSEGTQTKNSLIPLFQEKDLLYRTMDYYRPHYVHFCETLTDALGAKTNLGPYVDLQREFKERFPEIGIIRSIPIPANGPAADFPTLDIARALEPCSDLFLIDTWLGKEPVEGYIGITGRTADREMARKLVLQSHIPVVLAGGLSPENVYNAVLAVMPAGADSCSHTNRVGEKGKPERFKKDFDRVREFISEVRRAETNIEAKREELRRKLAVLEAKLQDREAALPAHSVRPHQIMIIEDLEEEISIVEKELKDTGS
ncbi:MAG: hypothetical protein KKE57_10430 [Proteobacteria bacterium]|nr:hypothetical protein [Pseudomonadota bacterium]